MPFAGNMPGIDIIASNGEECRTIHIQVKTRRGGKNWHSGIVGSQPTAPKDDAHNFWVLVDLGDVQTPPRYWIVPEWWIRDDIYQVHQAYLKKHGGIRPGNPDSTHHSIDESRLEQWKDRWDILGIFD